MKKHSDPKQNKASLRKKIIGLGESSIRKSYYPQLQQQLKKLEESERRFKELAELLPQVIFETDENGGLLFANQYASAAFFYTQDDLNKGLNAFQLFIPEDRERARKDFSAILSWEHAGNLEYTALRKDGSTFPVVVYASSIIRNNKPFGLRGILVDMTGRKLAEEALRESEEKYRTLVENIPQRIFSKDRHSVYLSCNENYARDLGVRPEEVAGKTDFDFFPKDLAEKYRSDDRDVMDSGETKGLEEQYIRGSEEMWVYTVKTPLRDKEGNIVGILGVFSDITEHKRAARERKKMEEQLVQAQKMESIGQLAGGIAHDFNNILSALIGYAHLLKMKMKENDPLRIYPDHILALSDRAANLTKSLLAFSRKQIINPRPVDLNEIIKRIDHLLSRIIGEDIKLQTVLSEKDLIAMADPGQIEQVLMNLATNAKDAMPDGGHLTIRTETFVIDSEFVREHGGAKEGEYALIKISDTGAGMDNETREKIFEPFFTTKEIGRGTGLGLSMAYGIVMQHEGYIYVFSEPGRGTAFSIYLPLIKAHAEEIKNEDTQSIERGSETILLAEDGTEVREFTRHLLEDNGYEVITAADGQDAIDKLLEHRHEIQFALLDVIMPNKSGKEVYAEIKKIKPDIKVLFMSGYPEDTIHKHGIIDKGAAYIKKPASPAELLRKIREVLSK